MKEIGKVVKMEEDKILVEFQRSKACENCNACIRLSDDDTMQVHLDNTVGAKLGDLVEVELAAKNIVKAGFLAYVIPLLLLIAGVLLGNPVGKLLGADPNIAGAILALVMLVVSFFVLRIINHVVEKKAGYSPQVCAIIKEQL